MELRQPTVRLVLLTVAAALPPFALAVLAVFEGSWLANLEVRSLVLVLAVGTLGWATAVAVIGGRWIGADLRAVIELAQRGEPAGGGARSSTTPPQVGNTALDRLAATLGERNRQIAELAAHLRAAPIQGSVADVAWATARAAVSVTRDPTWTLAVFQSPDETALGKGIYAADQEQAQPLTDVARWAATLSPDTAEVEAVRYGDGPWGAFVAVEVAAGADLRASLLAPWEGRAAPSRADRELLSLLGQNAAIALEHGLLVEQLRAQRETLNRVAAVQSDFLRGVTHDLQTPLTSIGAVASELRQQAGVTDSMRIDLDTIGHQADRLRRMVAQLLVASRLEAGSFEPRQEVFRVEPVVRRTWAALRAPRPFEVTVSGISHLAVGDPDRVEQVLWAILDNAVKYSPAGSPITVGIAGVGEEGRPICARIQIRDEGAGMDDETRARAFEQFYRASHARSAVPDGSGVGLYAARGLVEAMGGQILIDSRLGAGTAVTITLPAEKSDVEERVGRAEPDGDRTDGPLQGIP